MGRRTTRIARLIAITGVAIWVSTGSALASGYNPPAQPLPCGNGQTGFGEFTPTSGVGQQAVFTFTIATELGSFTDQKRATVYSYDINGVLRQLESVPYGDFVTRVSLSFPGTGNSFGGGCV